MNKKPKQKSTRNRAAELDRRVLVHLRTVEEKQEFVDDAHRTGHTASGFVRYLYSDWKRRQAMQAKHNL